MGEDTTSTLVFEPSAEIAACTSLSRKVTEKPGLTGRTAPVSFPVSLKFSRSLAKTDQSTPIRNSLRRVTSRIVASISTWACGRSISARIRCSCVHRHAGAETSRVLVSLSTAARIGSAPSAAAVAWGSAMDSSVADGSAAGRPDPARPVVSMTDWALVMLFSVRASASAVVFFGR